jgi:hypothetical protein
MYPNLTKLELFARHKRPGWDAWGNQIECDIALWARQKKPTWFTSAKTKPAEKPFWTWIATTRRSHRAPGSAKPVSPNAKEGLELIP